MFDWIKAFADCPQTYLVSFLGQNGQPYTVQLAGTEPAEKEVYFKLRIVAAAGMFVELAAMHAEGDADRTSLEKLFRSIGGIESAPLENHFLFDHRNKTINPVTFEASDVIRYLAFAGRQAFSLYVEDEQRKARELAAKREK